MGDHMQGAVILLAGEAADVEELVVLASKIDPDEACQAITQESPAHAVAEQLA